MDATAPGRRSRRRAVALAWGAAIAVGQSGAATACTFCQAAGGNSLRAYIGPTILLSMVPVAILGSIALWLRRSSVNSTKPPGEGTEH